MDVRSFTGYHRTAMSEARPPEDPHLGVPRRAPERDGGANADSGRAGYLGFVAHEIRNPLSTALWSAELLARLAPEERGGARGEKLSGMCLRALQRIRLLFEDHFLTERLEVGGLPLRPQGVALSELVHSLAARAGVMALSVGGDASATAVADHVLLERAVEALLAAAGRERAAVRVELAMAGGVAELRVSGAPPASDDPFARPQKGAPADSSGRALSLHMAAVIAEALGGSLDVDEGAYRLRVPAASRGVEEP